MGACTSTNLHLPNERKFRRAIKLYEVGEVKSMTNLLNRNKCFESGDLPITLAAREGHEAVIEELICGGADVNKLDKNGHGPLHIAVHMNDEESVNILLENGADPNKYNIDSKTPLHIAAERGYITMVQLLLDAGADPDDSYKTLSPLIFALQNKHSECVEEILQWNADPNNCDDKGNAALHLSVSNGDYNSTKALILYGANVHAVGRDRCSFVCIATCNGNSDILKILAQNGCDLDELFGEDSLPPIHAAAVRGQFQCINVLLSYNVNVDVKDRKGHNPLFNVISFLADPDNKLFYYNYFSTLYRNYARFDPMDNVLHESLTKCAMCLVQGGANLNVVWQKFSQIFPSYEGITFEQMVLCEVLIQGFGFKTLSHSRIRTLIQKLLNIREHGLIKLLFSAGVMPCEEDENCLRHNTEETDQYMFKWICGLRNTPRQLRDLSRRQIRNILSTNVLFLIEKLNVSQPLKEYICIMDTDYYSEVEVS